MEHNFDSQKFSVFRTGIAQNAREAFWLNGASHQKSDFYSDRIPSNFRPHSVSKNGRKKNGRNFEPPRRGGSDRRGAVASPPMTFPRKGLLISKCLFETESSGSSYSKIKTEPSGSSYSKSLNLT
uniref:Uncharacterized protein n=1 Tax=Cacopsylla melanoneura TaxID=428564 RepID=A0A8D8Q5H8_9HEMI